MAVAWRNNVIVRECLVKERHAGLCRGLWTRVSYVLLHQIDLILTLCGASFGFHELNHIIKSLLSTPLQLVAVKLVVPILIAWFVPSKLLIPGIALLIAAAFWNVKELLYLF